MINLLRAACRGAGSQRIWAQANGLSRQYVTDILKGRRPVTDTVANALGYERVVMYRLRAERRSAAQEDAG